MALPGDIILTRNVSIWARLIRFGAALRDQPDVWNHVIVVSHTDASGTLWGVEGRPGGAGWVDLRATLANRWTISNIDQPKTDQQRAGVVAVAKGLVGTPYDWAGIVADAMDAINAPALWRPAKFGDAAPAHVVCSSLAAYAYLRAGLPGPGDKGDPRTVTPANWGEWILRREWDGNGGL